VLQAASIFGDLVKNLLVPLTDEKCQRLLGDNKSLINLLQKYIGKKQKHHFKGFDFEHFLKMLARLLILRNEVSAHDIVHMDRETEPLLHRDYEDDNGKYKSVSC
jgi:hypothetical protein